MNNNLGLFRAARRVALGHPAPRRKLYTDHIYPYPYNYFNNVVYPSQHLYRETWEMPQRAIISNVAAKWGFRMFWVYFWYQLFSDPGVIIGHTHHPDPSKWTDAELGIPSDEEGSYYDWLRERTSK